MVGKRWTKPLSSSRLTSPHDRVTIGIGSYAENEFPPTIGHDREVFPMAVINIDGFYDLHVHSAPAPFVRIGDSVDIAEWCAKAGMAGIVIKSHFESTVSKVHHARREVTKAFPDFRVFAGIALNRGVGGVNPGAVEIALDQGAKIVWLPTFDAQNHARVFGATGTYGFKSMTLESKGLVLHEEFTVLEKGRLTGKAKEVIDLVAAYDAILATGHVSKEEIFATFEYALSKNVRKLLVTHPEYYVPNLAIRDLVELSKLGAFMEFCAVSCGPMTPANSIEQVKEMIDAVGPERAIISSDTGQPFSPRPPEALRVFAQCLHERGIDEDSIAQMTIRNSADLLGVGT